jgi:hypothetical protein
MGMETRAGAAAGAEALLHESQAFHRQMFGEAHPEYAMALNNLAYAPEVQGGCRTQRRSWIRRSTSRVRGDQHPRVRPDDAEPRATSDRAWRRAATERTANRARMVTLCEKLERPQHAAGYR